ncbi:MAG: hypothetical protein EA398_03890, partial [Deltaproteobacteria bacterium]
MTTPRPIDPRLPELLYGELPENEAAALREEIAADPALGEQWEALRMLHQGLGEREPVTAPPALRADILRAARLQREERPTPWWMAWWIPGGVLVAAAVAAVVLLGPLVGDRHPMPHTVERTAVAVDPPHEEERVFEPEMALAPAPPSAAAAEAADEAIAEEEAAVIARAPAERAAPREIAPREVAPRAARRSQSAPSSVDTGAARSRVEDQPLGAASGGAGR